MKLLRLIPFLFVALLFAACSNTDEAGKIDEKIKSGQQLSQADWSVMIEYCGRYAQDAEKIQDKINAEAPDSPEYQKQSDALAKLTADHPYLDDFNAKIANASQQDVGVQNVELINKYAALEYFTAPSWANIQTDPNVEGFIEEMPAKDTGAVIAAGAGEEVK